MGKIKGNSYQASGELLSNPAYDPANTRVPYEVADVVRKMVKLRATSDEEHDEMLKMLGLRDYWAYETYGGQSTKRFSSLTRAIDHVYGSERAS